MEAETEDCLIHGFQGRNNSNPFRFAAIYSYHISFLVPLTQCEFASGFDFFIHVDAIWYVMPKQDDKSYPTKYRIKRIWILCYKLDIIYLKCFKLALFNTFQFFLLHVNEVYKR